ncbi:MAG: asparaginase [Halolamina sp.]
MSDSDTDDRRPRVHVVGCGGTIASEPGDDGAAPEKTAADLLAAVPGLTDHARVTAETVADRPGFDMTFGAIERAAAAIRAATDEGRSGDGNADQDRKAADGVVVTHGTDTLADTAYALALVDLVDRPVVVTGAQRRLDEPSSDVAANLTTAVRAAGDDRFAPGVHVAFDGELHPAADVVKRHTTALGTFGSPDAGLVAAFSRSGVRIHREPRNRTPTVRWLGDDGPPAGELSVPVVHSGTGVDAAPLRRALAADVDGVVVAGTGLGNVTGPLGEALADAADRLPVVVASRCHAGPTEPVYGTPGGAVSLAEAGVAFAGDLPTAKARLTLICALAAGRSEPTASSLYGNGSDGT